MGPNTVTPPDPTMYVVPMPLRGMSTAAFALGFFALVVFWWFPLATFFSSMGVVYGVLAFLINEFRIRSGRGGSDYRFRLFALGGAAFSALVLGIVISTYFGIRVMMQAL